MKTITSCTEISQLFSSGKRIKTPYVTFIVGERASETQRGADEQHDQCGRVAFIAGKKLGNAVWRNSAKRRMRALCGEMGGPWPGKDVIFLARGAVCRASYQDVSRSCEQVQRRLDSCREDRAHEEGR